MSNKLFHFSIKIVQKEKLKQNCIFQKMLIVLQENWAILSGKIVEIFREIGNGKLK